MCGIVGIFCLNDSVTVDKQELIKMRDTMVHRGPDGQGCYVSADSSLGLGHRRLSIVDLSESATQPMPNENFSIWVTFNGEIYNHLSLRHELQAAGHKFRTSHSDTEVIIHGYEEWGIDGLLKRLEGDWAIGLWDSNKKKLFLTRDRLGVKPIYFSLQDEIFLFASEIKAILAHSAVKRDVDPVAMYHYLTFLTTPAPLTMFKGVYKLAAGQCIELAQGGQIRGWHYWDALPGQSPLVAQVRNLNQSDREDYYIEGIRKRLTKAVKNRMMSDVPSGVLLSGGVDSSTIVAMLANFMDRPVETFTVGFKDHTHLNELQYADLVAKKFKTNHHQILIDESDMIGYLNELIYYQDEPLADWVCIPLHFVSKLAKENGVTVIQVGEGADEQFSGYASYLGYIRLYQKYWKPYRKLMPKSLQRVIASIALWAGTKIPSFQVYADIADRAAKNREHFWTGAISLWESMKAPLVRRDTIVSEALPEVLATSGLFPSSYFKADSFNVVKGFFDQIDSKYPNQDVLTRMTYSEFKLRLPELLLMRVDKITMESSIEARVPFLDHELVEFTMDLPMSEKLSGKVPKYLLKKAVEGIIPDEIINREKMGFGAPMKQWLKGEFGRQVERLVFDSSLISRDFFDQKTLKKLFHDHFSGRRDNSLYLWTIYNLTAWYDYWIDRKMQ
ncbi:asparagine synthase (glutamine-hydrolyzing) [Alphaproteobacteria bacterium]|nr:asparagine synthase (glutamine-hydrolyzing) [Alphaproteobacteria bacterium]